jgi:hypothetical protein
LKREQYYLDLIFSDKNKPNTYNILQVAGSSLDYKHIEKSLVKISESKIGENHPMFGKEISPGIRTKIIKALSNPEIRTKMSFLKSDGHKPRLVLLMEQPFLSIILIEHLLILFLQLEKHQNSLIVVILRLKNIQ